MKCKNCGKEIENDSSFCSYCGTEISTDSANTTKENVSSEKKKMPLWLNIILIILGIIVMMLGWAGLQKSL